MERLVAHLRSGGTHFRVARPLPLDPRGCHPVPVTGHRLVQPQQRQVASMSPLWGLVQRLERCSPQQNATSQPQPPLSSLRHLVVSGRLIVIA